MNRAVPGKTFWTTKRLKTKCSGASPLEFILLNDGAENLLAGGVADLLFFAHFAEVVFIQSLSFFRGLLGSGIFRAFRRRRGLSAALTYAQAQAHHDKTGYSADCAFHVVPGSIAAVLTRRSANVFLYSGQIPMRCQAPIRSSRSASGRALMLADEPARQAVENGAGG